MDDRQIIETLYAQYSEKGFISEDEALCLFIENKVSLSSIDSLTEQLLLRGVIIKANENDDDEYDRGQTDFETLYREAIHADPSLRHYIEYVRQIQPPQHREWQMLLPQYKSGNQYAQNRLFEMYLRYVVKIAYSYYQRLGVPLADTIQEGNIGLLLALEKYDMAEHGVFPSYYQMWVMQNITRNMEFCPNPLFYFPAHIKDKLYKLYHNIEADGGIGDVDLSSPALLESVMEEMDCAVEDAKEYLKFFEPMLSIEGLLASEINIFSDNGALEKRMIEAVDSILLHDTIWNLLSQLKPKEAEVLKLHYGLADDNECTLEEIGKKFGLTRERIRQIEVKALKKFTHPNRVDRLQVFFNAQS